MKQDEDVLAAALEGLAGAALVLDERRRVRLATPEALKLLVLRHAMPDANRWQRSCSVD